MSKVISDIARQRSNEGFTQLDTRSRPVRKFANKMDATPEETMDRVVGTVQRSYDPRRMTHTERAGYRLIDLRDKQAKKVREYDEGRRQTEKIGNDEASRSFEAMKPRDVEEKFFGTTQKTAKQQAARRRQIKEFVKRGGWPKR
jgi:G3E family GTPase